VKTDFDRIYETNLVPIGELELGQEFEFFDDALSIGDRHIRCRVEEIAYNIVLATRSVGEHQTHEAMYAFRPRTHVSVRTFKEVDIAHDLSFGDCSAWCAYQFRCERENRNDQ